MYKDNSNNNNESDDILESYFNKLPDTDRSDSEKDYQAGLILSMVRKKNKTRKSTLDRNIFSYPKIWFGQYPLYAYSATAIALIVCGWYLLGYLIIGTNSHSNVNHENTIGAEQRNQEKSISQDNSKVVGSSLAIAPETFIIDSMFVEFESRGFGNETEIHTGERQGTKRAYDVIVETLKSNGFRIANKSSSLIQTEWNYQQKGTNSYAKNRLIVQLNSKDNNLIYFMIENFEIDSELVDPDLIVDKKVYSRTIQQIKSQYHKEK